MPLIEIVLFIGGIYSIVTAKVPAFLVGGGFYHVDRWIARTIGVLVMIPLPIAIFGGEILTYLFGDKSAENPFSIEIVKIVPLFVVGILVLVLTRVVGRQIEPASDTEAIIAKKTQRALTCAVMSVFIVIYAPWAFIYANQALKLIDENSVGEQYRDRAKMARIIASVAILLSIIACLILILIPIYRFN